MANDELDDNLEGPIPLQGLSDILPTRGEVRRLSVPVDPSKIASRASSGVGKDAGSQNLSVLGASFTRDSNGSIGFGDTSTSVVRVGHATNDDFDVTNLSVKGDPNFIYVKIQDRGYDQESSYGSHAYYKFLINPNSLSCNRSVIDAQSMTRAGWQVGIWGDDVIEIRLEGYTAGAFFSDGTTDLFEEYTASYRNLQDLIAVFENNGYWYEGESQSQGPLAAEFTRRKIQLHADVELVVGNFIWRGMFTELTIDNDASSPFNAKFSIGFMAWKERFKSTSPWLDSIHNDVYRGHAYERYPLVALKAQAEADKKAEEAAAAEEWAQANQNGEFMRVQQTTPSAPEPAAQTPQQFLDSKIPQPGTITAWPPSFAH